MQICNHEKQLQIRYAHMLVQMPNSLKNRQHSMQLTTKKKKGKKRNCTGTRIAAATADAASVFHLLSCSFRSELPQGRPRRWSDCTQGANAAHKTKTNKRATFGEGGEGRSAAGNGSARQKTSLGSLGAQ